MNKVIFINKKQSTDMNRKQPLKETFARIGGKLNEFDDDSMKAYGDAVTTAYGNDPNHSMMNDDEANKLADIVGPLETFYNRLVAENRLDDDGKETLRHEIISFIQDNIFNYLIFIVYIHGDRDWL